MGSNHVKGAGLMAHVPYRGVIGDYLEAGEEDSSVPLGSVVPGLPLAGAVCCTLDALGYWKIQS